MSLPPEALCIETIGRERNGDMLRIIGESPIETPGLTVAFDRAPDVFAIPELFSERVTCLGFLEAEELLGFAMLSYQKRYVNGEPRLVMYYGCAHVKPEGRGRGFLYRISDRLFRDHDERSDIGYAIVMAGNRPAERIIGPRRFDYPYLPASRIAGTLCARNILILGRRKESAGFRVRRATPADTDAMVSLLQEEYRARLFGPVIDRAAFLENAVKRPGCGLEDHYVAERDGEIVGTCAAWDTERLRQTRVIRYGARLRLAAKAHALLAGPAGFPPMPREGERIKDVTITDAAVRERSPEILEALLRTISNDLYAKRCHMMTVGSCRRDPLLRATRAFVGFTVVSNIVLFAGDPTLIEEGRVDASLPYVDLAMV